MLSILYSKIKFTELGVIFGTTYKYNGHMYFIGFVPLAIDIYRIFVSDSQFGIKVALYSKAGVLLASDI